MEEEPLYKIKKSRQLGLRFNYSLIGLVILILLLIGGGIFLIPKFNTNTKLPVTTEKTQPVSTTEVTPITKVNDLPRAVLGVVEEVKNISATEREFKIRNLNDTVYQVTVSADNKFVLGVPPPLKAALLKVKNEYTFVDIKIGDQINVITKADIPKTNKIESSEIKEVGYSPR